MAAFLGNLRSVVIASFLLAALLFLLYVVVQGYDGPAFELFLLRWLHVICGVMWIGLLWYFDFVSTPMTPTVAEGMRPALGRCVTPQALFWIRWSAMGTILFGIALAVHNNYLAEAYSLDLSQGLTGFPVVPKYLDIGIGMWLGTIMWFNVWFVIWPSQQKALNIGGRFPHLPAPEMAAAGNLAGLYSRINTLLSLPMLFSMMAAGHLY